MHLKKVEKEHVAYTKIHSYDYHEISFLFVAMCLVEYSFQDACGN